MLVLRVASSNSRSTSHHGHRALSEFRRKKTIILLRADITNQMGVSNNLVFWWLGAPAGPRNPHFTEGTHTPPHLSLPPASQLIVYSIRIPFNDQLMGKLTIWWGLGGGGKPPATKKLHLPHTANDVKF